MSIVHLLGPVFIRNVGGRNNGVANEDTRAEESLPSKVRVLLGVGLHADAKSVPNFDDAVTSCGDVSEFPVVELDGVLDVRAEYSFVVYDTKLATNAGHNVSKDSAIWVLPVATLERDISAGASTRLDDTEVTSVDLNVRSEHELQFGGRGRSGRRILSGGSGGIDHSDESATMKYKAVGGVRTSLHWGIANSEKGPLKGFMTPVSSFKMVIGTSMIDPYNLPGAATHEISRKPGILTLNKGTAL